MILKKIESCLKVKVVTDITCVKCSTILHVLIFNGLLMVFVFIHIHMSMFFYSGPKDLLFTMYNVYLSLNERIQQRVIIHTKEGELYLRGNFPPCQFHVMKQWIGTSLLLVFSVANYFSSFTFN